MFEVELSFDSSATISSPSTQLDISTKIKSATSSYLFDFFDSIVSQYDHDNQSWSAFEGIELQVSLHTVGEEVMMIHDTKQKSLKAEMNGNVSFSRTKLEHGFVLDTNKVAEITHKAFLGKYALDDYLTKVQNILPEVVAVRVQSDAKYEVAASKGGMKAGIIMLTIAMVCSLTLLSIWFYREQQFKNHGRRTRKGHLLMDVDQHSDCYDDDEIGNFTGFQSDQTFDSEPVQFIPVPARINEVTDGDGRKHATTKQPEVTPRRYVTPASPFELLYGAAFSHNDRKKVQKAKRKSTRFFHAPKAKQMKPLNTITEVNEDDGNNNESFFPQKIMSSITSFISEKMDGSSQKNKEDFVVFRDFPRHDGTPCVMFTPVGEVDWEANKQNEKAPPSTAFPTKTNIEEDDTDLSYDSTVGSLTNLKDDSNGEVDTFVDKLESLMADRSRQYEERKKFEAELEDEKKRRAEEKSQQDVLISTGSCEDGKNETSATESTELIDLCSIKIVHEKDDETDCDLFNLKDGSTLTKSEETEEIITKCVEEKENRMESNLLKLQNKSEQQNEEESVTRVPSPREVETAHFDSNDTETKKPDIEDSDPTECDAPQEIELHEVSG